MKQEKELTGRTVLMITLVAFGIIIAVNVTMAVKAVRTFPGLEVDNSYVASQQFDRLRDAQEALGWDIALDYRRGELVLDIRDGDGFAVEPLKLDVLIGRTTESRDDIRPELVAYGDRFRAPLMLDHGKWMVRVQATAPDGTPFQKRLELFVRPEG